MSTSLLRGRDLERLLIVDLTGAADRHLTPTEVVYPTLRFTGTLAAARTLRFDISPTEDRGRSWVVENLTDQVLTFRPVSGSGIDVAVGVNLSFWYDGVNFIGQAAAAAAGLPAVIGSAEAVIPVDIDDPQIGDALTFIDDGEGGFLIVNQSAAQFFQVILTIDDDYVLGTDDATEVNATNIELRAGTVDHPWRLDIPDTLPGKTYIIENTTGQTVTLVGDDASEVYLVNDARCQVLWDGDTLTRTWLSTPTFFAIASTDPLDFDTWDQIDADYVEIIPVAGNITVNWPNGGSLGKRGRRQTIKNDHETSWIDVKTDGAGPEVTTRLLPGETCSFVIDNAGALVPDWTRSFERRVTVTHDDNATYTVLHPDFLAQVIVVEGDLSATRNLVLPTVNHHSWVLVNAADEALVVKTAAGTGVTLYPGKTRRVACDGTNLVPMSGSTVTSGVEYIHQRASDGQLTLGLSTPNANGAITQPVVIAGNAYLSGDVTFNALVDFILPTSNGPLWGTAANQTQAWWGGTPGVQMTHSGDTVEEQVDNLLTQMSSRGLFAPYVSPLSVSPWLFVDPRNFAGAHDDPVGTLTDSSGNNRSATAAGGLRGLLQVTSNLSPNGSRTIELDGVDDSYDHTTSMPAVGSGIMYTIAGNFDTNGGSGQVIFTDNGTQRPQLIVETAGTNLYAFRDEGHTHTFGAFAGGWQVLQWVFYPPDDGTGIARLYKNGVQVGTDGVWDWNPASSTGFIVSGGPLPAKGYLGPIIITPGLTTDSAREGLRAWINARYGAP